MKFWYTHQRLEPSALTLSESYQQQNLWPFWKDSPHFKVIFVSSDNDSLNFISLASIQQQSFSRFTCYLDKKADFCEKDPRFEFVVDASEIEVEPSDWIVVVRSGEVLNPTCFYYWAREMIRCPSVQLVYHFQTFGDAKGHISYLLWKPTLDFFTLKNVNFVRGLFAVGGQTFLENKELILKNPWGCLKRVAEQNINSRCIPKFLHHEIQSEFGNPPKFEAENQIIKTDRAGNIAVIVCFKDKAELTVTALKHLLSQVGNLRLSLYLVNNQSQETEAAIIQSFIKQSKVEVVWIDVDEPFNYSRMHNKAFLRLKDEDYIFLLNNDVFLTQPEALSKMVEVASRPEAGVVGLRLLYPNEQLQCAGVFVEKGRNEKIFQLDNQTTQNPFVKMDHLVPANTFAAVVFKRSLLERVGMLDDVDFPIIYNDVDFCFRCLKLGLKNYYLGSVSAIHFESVSRKKTNEFFSYQAFVEKHLSVAFDHLQFDLKLTKFRYSTLFRMFVRLFPHRAAGKFKLYEPKSNVS